MLQTDLNGNWSGCCITPDGTQDFSFVGFVPGCVHTDLAGSRIPGDLYFRDNADKCQWIENCDWCYTKTFMLDSLPGKSVLVFEGLDVYADIELNGHRIASTDNMFIAHRFDVSEILQSGENELSVYFHSPIRMVDGREHRNGAFTCERMHTRRIQCTYGWDWVARFVTSGIWRSVYIDHSDGFRVESAYIYTEHIRADSAQIVVEATFEDYENGGYADMEIVDPDGKVIYRHRWFRRESFLKEYIDIPNAKLWYPAGYGEQPLYTLHLNGKQFPFGIRTAVILQMPDEQGSKYHELCLQIKDTVSGQQYDKNETFSGFQLLINDIPVMCKGANWVPSESFPSAETDEKITRLLTLAKQVNLNMLRVWGGGIFEKQHFYSECDRLGILVTQDFLMACGEYPEEKDSFIRHMQAEAEFAALELRNHPCLVWWSGDNENAVDGNDEADNYHGRTAIHEGIYPVLNRLDPKRRFLLSSPCGGSLYASKTVGTTHNTQYLGCSIFPYIMDSDMQDYKEHFAQYLARFIAEEPTMGAVCYPSLKRFMTDTDIFDGDEMWQYHTKSNPGLSFTLFDVLLAFSSKVLGSFADGKDRFFKMKYNQYEWIRISMENIRRNRGFINGIVYWMWNDCWPAASGWAFVDYYCLPKASYYSFKRCAGEWIVSIDKQEEFKIYVCNDGQQEKNITLRFSRLSDGELCSISAVTVAAQAASAQCAYSLPLSCLPENGVLFCDAYCDGQHDRAFYKNGNLPVVPTAQYTIVSQTEDAVTVRAKNYIHAFELEGEYVFSDNYFSLFPNEERTVTMHSLPDAKTNEISFTAYTL